MNLFLGHPVEQYYDFGRYRRQFKDVLVTGSSASFDLLQNIAKEEISSLLLISETPTMQPTKLLQARVQERRKNTKKKR